MSPGVYKSLSSLLLQMLWIRLSKPQAKDFFLTHLVYTHQGTNFVHINIFMEAVAKSIKRI